MQGRTDVTDDNEAMNVIKEWLRIRIFAFLCWINNAD
jgi:hypothetical protein